ncbi:MAG TPA: hypothetical protein PKD28_03420 [Candidatus Saccharibacteria bacterium]|nr:hypothetical protein [Candidatus Saccharibacteria bacterium]
MDIIHYVMIALSALWGVATVTSFVLWSKLGRVRPNGKRFSRSPGVFAWFSLIGFAVSLSLLFIQDHWLGLWWSLGILAIGGLLVYVISRSKWLDLIVTLAVAGLLLVPLAPAAAQAFAGWNPTPTPTASAEESDKDPVTQVTTDETDIPAVYPQRYLDILRDNGYTTEVIDGQEIPVFQAKSTKRYDDQRKDWVDAVCLPVANREAVLAMILGSPDCAAQVASGLYRLPIIGLDGTTQQVGDHSPWLAQFKDPEGLNDWAQAAMASEGADRIEYARKLVLIAILVEQFADGGVEDGRETDYNFHVVDRLAVDEQNPWDSVPEFALSPKQYKGDFVVFRVTYKGYEGCWSEFGINIGDGRFAGFTCETPTPEPTPEPTPTTSTPPPTSDPEPKCEVPGKGHLPPGHPDCKTTPNPDPKCEVPGKGHLPPGHPDCKPDPEPKCEVPGKGHLPPNHPDCKPEEPKLVEVCDPNDNGKVITVPEGEAGNYPKPGDPACSPKDGDDDRIRDEDVNPAEDPDPDQGETEEPVEDDPAPAPSDPGGSEGDEVTNLPADDVDPGTGEEPRDEDTIPDVPDDVPGNEDESPIEGDVDPDAAAAAAAALAFAPLVFWGIGTRRKLRENA